MTGRDEGDVRILFYRFCLFKEGVDAHGLLAGKYGEHAAAEFAEQRVEDRE